MKQLMRLPLGIAIVGVLALGTVGCSIAPPATFYQLQPSNTETASRASNISVLLGPVRVADYLQRENVLQREADGSLSLSQQARWAGSLQDDIGLLLLRQMSAQLGSSRIALYPDRVGIEAQAQVVLSISRLDRVSNSLQCWKHSGVCLMQKAVCVTVASYVSKKRITVKWLIRSVRKVSCWACFPNSWSWRYRMLFHSQQSVQHVNQRQPPVRKNLLQKK